MVYLLSRVNSIQFCNLNESGNSTIPAFPSIAGDILRLDRMLRRVISVTIGLFKFAAFFQLFFRRWRPRLVARACGKNGRPILSSDVRTLAVKCGRIVDAPKNFEQFFVADLAGIEFDLHNFGVAGPIAAHVVVGRICPCSAGISDGSSGHASDFSERRFHAPKTAGGKDGFFHKS